MIYSGQEIVGMIVNAITLMVVYSAYIVLFSFIFWMIVDAAKQDRFWWVVIILGLPVVGSVVYFYTEKKHEYAKIASRHIHSGETEEQHEVTPKKLARKKKKVEVVEVVEVVEEKKGTGESAIKEADTEEEKRYS